MDRELREVEEEVLKSADKDIRESAQIIDEHRLNFGLVQVVYEWARNKVKNKTRNTQQQQNSSIISRLLNIIFVSFLFTSHLLK